MSKQRGTCDAPGCTKWCDSVFRKVNYSCNGAVKYVSVIHLCPECREYDAPGMIENGYSEDLFA